MQSGRIKADALQASSSADSNHSPDQGRLHFQKTGSKVGAWSAKINDAHQWFQAKFDVVAKVRSIGIQGRMDYDQWVTVYTLAYSFDGKNWKDYELNGKVTVSSNQQILSIVETVNYNDWGLESGDWNFRLKCSLKDILFLLGSICLI